MPAGAAVSSVAAARARAVAVPVWLWLAALVIASIAARVAIGRENVAPWIMIDELVYSDLARSIAANGHLLVRGVPSHGYGIVYPVLIAPAWRLFGPMPDVYAAAKAINSFLMSLSAIPAYYLARRVLPVRLALAVAALAVLIPSMLYTGMLMTENAFYPLFMVVALACVTMLERPTARLQVGVLALCLVAFETRAQAVALIPAIAVAPVLLVALERRGLRGLRPFAPLYGILAGGAVLAVAGTVARGRSPLSLLGAYRAATSSTYTPSGVLHFFLYHVSELDLYLGIVPFAALIAIWLSPRRVTPAVRAFAVASFTVSLFLIAEVAAFASQASVDRIEERNMFYLAPFGLIALLGLAAGIVPTARRPVLVAAAIAGVLPVFIPFKAFITTSAVSDTFALLPWWWAQDHFFHVEQARWVALGISLAAAAVFVVLPRRYALVLPALVAVYFVATAVVVENGRHGIHKTTVGDSWAGTHLPRPDWIDRLVGRNAQVSFLWDGGPGGFPVWEDEFFNRSVRNVYDVNDAQRPDPLPEIPVSRAPNGRLVTAAGQPIGARYVVAPTTLDVGGTLIQPDPIGYGLYRVDGPVVVLTKVTGVYEGDTWSGPGVTYQRVECTGGTVSVQLGSDPSLFSRAQTVVASEGGRVVGRASIAPAGQSTLKVPLVPRAGVCTVRFAVGYTLVPARVHPAVRPRDTRRLGAHFLAFDYHP
jgi:hypothetical protein